MIGGLVFLSRAQTRVWNNNLTLWEHAAAMTPTHTVLYYLGGFLKERDPARAAGLFRRSADMNPRFGLAWYEYAKLAHAGGDLREAERAYVEASKYLVQQYVAHVDLGVMYYVQGRREEAVRQYELAVASVERADEVDKQGRPYMVMGLAMLDMGRRDEAAAWFRKALGFVDTREGAAGALREMGMTP